MSDIFISYSRHDKDVVLPFVKSIEQKIGAVCWIDLEGIEYGSQFEDVIVDAIDASKVVLFMLSDHSLASKWTKREVIYAEDEGKRIVPVVVDGKGLRKWFKFHFGNIDYVDLNSQEQQEKLYKNLATWLGVKIKETPSAPPPSNAQHKLAISADGKEIKLNIIEGCDLVLKKDAEKGCYVGEIPVAKVAETLEIWVKSSSKAATVGAILGTVAGPLGVVAGGVLSYIGGYRQIKDKHGQTFNAIIEKLNAKYGICLKKRESEESEFMVELYR